MLDTFQWLFRITFCIDLPAKRYHHDVRSIRYNFKINAKPKLFFKWKCHRIFRASRQRIHLTHILHIHRLLILADVISLFCYYV